MASKADLDPPITKTDLMVGEERRGTLVARSRVWIMGGVKSLVGKEGMLGVEVRPVAMMSFLQVKVLPVDVFTLQRF